MKYLVNTLGWTLLSVILILSSCNKDEESFSDQNDHIPESTILHSVDHSLQKKPESIPEATVEYIRYERKKLNQRDGVSCAENVSPSSLALDLDAGESLSSSLTGCIDALPEKADIVFLMDLTGSMGAELNNLKVKSVNIMNAVSSNFSDSRFGVVSCMDYPTVYTSCGYSSGYGSVYDYPYNLDVPLTDDKNSVESGINGLSLGSGSDYPESFGRAFYELLYDTNLGWRDDAAKVVVTFLDALPHSCALGTGADPGRDGIVGTDDDVVFEDVIDELAAANINLIVLNSGVHSVFWSDNALITGGESFDIAGNGSFPDGMEITETINDLIVANLSEVNEVKLEAQSGYEDWISSADIYGPILSTDGFSGSFDIAYSVPAGTPDGTYSFVVNLVGDGAVYGSQVVEIEVVSDQDDDGCLDDEDPHPLSDTSETVVIDGCDSGVPNVFVTPCSTMMDLIQDCIDNAVTHGDMVSCISGLTNDWKSAGIISGKQKGKIMPCAGQANLP